MPRGLKNQKRQAKRRAIRRLPSGDDAAIILAESDSELEWIEAADDSESKLRKFRMVAYTGGKLRVAAYYYPIIVDLSGLKVSAKSRPVLRDHMISRVVGHTESIQINAGNIAVSGVVSGGEGEHAREVTALADNGFPWQVSIGASPSRVVFVDKGETVEVNGRKFSGPVYVARSAALKEVSFVALGADDNTSARMAASFNLERGDMPTFEEWLQAKSFDADELSEDQLTALRAAYDAEVQASSDDTPGDPPPAPPAAPSGDTSEADRIRAEAADEVERVQAIGRICAQYDGPTITENGTEVSLEAHAIRHGWDANRTELNALRASRPAAPAAHRPEPATAQTIEAACLLAVGIPEAHVGDMYGEKVTNEAIAAKYRDMSLHVVMDRVIHAAGMSYSGSRKSDDFIRAAFSAHNQIAASGTSFSTLSLTGILSNVANKALISAYNSVEAVWRNIAAVRSHSDFKTHTRYRLDRDGSFKKVSKDGELKQVSFSDDSYTNALDTFGALVSLTRQDMINDDLNALVEIARSLGIMGATRLEEAVMVQVITGETNSFFSAGNNNYISGAGTVLDIDGLSEGRKNFRNQVDTNGKPILITPKYLLVGSTLETTALDLHQETRVDVTTTANKRTFATNPHVNKYQPLVSPYVDNTDITDQDGDALTGQSATQWFLFADPAVRAAIAVAFLNGRQMPTIESGAVDFDRLGMAWRGYFDFGVGYEDPKAALKSKGAA